MKKSPLQRRTSLSSRSSLERRTAPKRRRGVSPASPQQREKVKGSVCRECGKEPVDPAHVISRAAGGGDDPRDVIPLCREHHRLFDDGKLDILRLLTKEEQAHAVSHVGIISALQRTTNLHWIPEEHGRESVDG